MFQQFSLLSHEQSHLNIESYCELLSLQVCRVQSEVIVPTLRPETSEGLDSDSQYPKDDLPSETAHSSLFSL